MSNGPPDRLPPGQRRTEKWPVLDLGVKPVVDPENYRLTVDGLVQTPLELDPAAIAAAPQETRRNDIHCVTAWSRFDNEWQGLSPVWLAGQAGVAEAARHVVLHGLDGYTTNLPRAVFLDPTVLLATHWQGAPLTPDHGAPLRAVIPGRYFWKSAKWLCRIEFVAEDRPGFWETRGYHNDGDPWAEQRFTW